jgi:hypothetical protein
MQGSQKRHLVVETLQNQLKQRELDMLTEIGIFLHFLSIRVEETQSDDISFD